VMTWLLMLVTVALLFYGLGWVDGLAVVGCVNFLALIAYRTGLVLRRAIQVADAQAEVRAQSLARLLTDLQREVSRLVKR